MAGSPLTVSSTRHWPSPGSGVPASELSCVGMIGLKALVVLVLHRAGLRDREREGRLAAHLGRGVAQPLAERHHRAQVVVAGPFSQLGGHRPAAGCGQRLADGEREPAAEHRDQDQDDAHRPPPQQPADPVLAGLGLPGPRAPRRRPRPGPRWPGPPGACSYGSCSPAVRLARTAPARTGPARTALLVLALARTALLVLALLILALLVRVWPVGELRGLGVVGRGGGCALADGLGGTPVVALAYLLVVPASSSQKVYRLKMKESLQCPAYPPN